MNPGGDPVDLDEQHGRRVGRVTRVRERLHGSDDPLIHHLEGRRHDPRRDDRRDRRRAVLHRREVHEHRRDRGRLRREANADGRHEPNGALGADDHASEVVARRLRSLRAQTHHAPIGEHDVHRQDVRGGDAVRETVRPAGVRPHVAADRRHLLRGGVGHIGEAGAAECRPQVEVEEPRLHPREPVLRPDLEDAVHLRGHDDESVADRRRRPREPGAAPAGDHGEVVRGRRANACHDVVRRAGEDDEGRRALDHRGVTRVQPERERVRQHFAGAERVLELSSRQIHVRHRGLG